jgi:tRNA A37 threonylcarbamoyladenosine synthetase subunit TsaC/SUA5/YrdC
MGEPGNTEEVGRHEMEAPAEPVEVPGSVGEGAATPPGESIDLLDVSHTGEMGSVEDWLGPAVGHDEPAAGPGGEAAVDAGVLETVNPPVVGVGATEIVAALDDGEVVALPGVGGYCLAVLVGVPGAEARLDALAADPEGPHYVVGHRDDVRALTSRWNDEVVALLDRCWPGPVEVFLPRAVDGAPAEDDSAGSDDGAGATERTPGRDDTESSGGWAVTVGMPDGRALRRLCKEHGPWRTIPLNFNEAAEVAHAFDVSDVALVVEGGRREGEPPTLVDATVSPVRVLREGALPSQFVDATMAMGRRRRLFSRHRSD